MSIMKRDARTRPRGLTPKIKRMIEVMVYEGGTRDQAAEKVGITDRAGRAAFRKAEVLSAYNAALEVLRTSERSRNFHRLVDLRDQNDNRTAAVAAARVIEGLTEEGQGSRLTVNVSPGYVIVLDKPAPKQIEGRVADDTSSKQLIEQANSGNDGLTTAPDDDLDTLWVDGRAE